MIELPALDGSEGYEACDDERPPVALLSSPRDNLLSFTNFKNPEAQQLLGFLRTKSPETDLRFPDF